MNFHLFFKGSFQERLNTLLSRTQNFLNEVASPLAKPGQIRKSDSENEFGLQVMEDIFMVEQTIDRRMPCGILSLAAVICIEQFSRWIHMDHFMLGETFLYWSLGQCIHRMGYIISINKVKTKVYKWSAIWYVVFTLALGMCIKMIYSQNYCKNKVITMTLNNLYCLLFCFFSCLGIFLYWFW